MIAFFSTDNLAFAIIGWGIALTFAGVAIIQLVLLAGLMLWPTGERQPRQPKSPLMPTKPNLADQTKATIPMKSARVVVMAGLPDAELPFPADKFTFGRYYNPENAVLIALDERSISRRHAQFVGDEERREFYLTDLQSSYGTALQRPNGLLPLTPGTRMRIYNEDLVQFGQTVVLKFILPGEPRPFEPVAAQATSNYSNIPTRGGR
jgi:hypothetical protein